MINSKPEELNPGRDLPFYKNITDSIPFLVLMTDTSGLCVYASPNCQEISGFDEQDLLGKKLLWIHPDEKEIEEILLNAFKQGLAGKDLEYRARKKNGDFWYASTSWNPVYQNNKITGFVILTNDVTWNKISSDVLKASEERISTIFESTLDRIFVWDKDCNYMYANTAELKHLGKAKNQVIGQNIRSVIPGPNDKINFWINSTKSIFENGEPKKFEDQTDTEFEFNAGEILISPVNDTDGAIQAVVVVHRDITERKMQEKELQTLNRKLEESNSELEQFAYVASHDLQEPLRAITGYVQLLEKKYKNSLGNDAIEYISRTTMATERMRNLIEDLLKYSRVSTRAKEFEDVSLQSVLDKVKQNLSAQINSSGALIKSNTLPMVHADSSQMIQLFQNIISNGIKFTKKENPIIEIDSELINSDSEYLISIKDNGIGIEKEYMERIFLIFQRLHTRDEYPGTGIGLAVCKKIIDRHEGKIWVESIPGESSIFKFTLPTKTGRQ